MFKIKVDLKKKYDVTKQEESVFFKTNSEVYRTFKSLISSIKGATLAKELTKAIIIHMDRMNKMTKNGFKKHMSREEEWELTF